MKQPKKDIVWHNPENEDISTIPKGWRLLVEGEKIPIGNCLWELWIGGGWTSSGPAIKRDAHQSEDTTYIVGYPLPNAHMEEVNEWRPILEWDGDTAWLTDGICVWMPGGYVPNIATGFIPVEKPSPPVLEKTQEQKDEEAFKNFYESVDGKYIVTARMTWSAALEYARK